MKKYIPVAVLAGIAGLFILGGEVSPSRREAVFYPMGGIPFRVIAFGRDASDFLKDLSAAEKRVEKLEDVFNSFRRTSEISRINDEAHGRPFKMSADMKRVVESSIGWWKKSDGAFDITVGPLIKLWGAAGEKKGLPDISQLEAALQSVGTEKIEIRDDGIQIKMKGMEIGLGAIAKGDIADQVAEMLKKRGVRRGVVDAGGNVVVFGDKTFRFGIQDPTAKAGERIIGVIEMSEGSIVTSGNYERFVAIGGKKYSHIIDPKSGMPIDNGLEAATVIADKSIDADALATALMVMGREKAIELLRKNPEYKGILVEKNGDMYIVWVESDLISNTHFEEPWSDWIRTF